MKEFRIPMTHRPGEMAHVASSLARHDVNMKAVAAIAVGNQVVLHVVAGDHAEARTALEEANIRFEETEILTTLIEDKAGELADLALKLSKGGVNLEAIYMIGREESLVELAIAVDNISKAKKLLE
jgi:hypothetical protein